VLVVVSSVASQAIGWEERVQNDLLLGPTVFREPRNFEPSRGIWPLPRNFRVFAEFHGIPRKHGNSVGTAKFRKSVLLL